MTQICAIRWRFTVLNIYTTLYSLIAGTNELLRANIKLVCRRKVDVYGRIVEHSVDCGELFELFVQNDNIVKLGLSPHYSFPFSVLHYCERHCYVDC